MPKKQYKGLLDQIGGLESELGYNIAYGNVPIPLDQMTLGEIREYQKNRVKDGGQSAIGRYQFIGKTLQSIMDRNPKEFDKDKKFTPDLQDRAGEILIDRRGGKKFLEGKMPMDEFAQNMSQEWASFPSPATGESHYSDDGINKSRVPLENFYNMLEEFRAPPVEEPQQAVEQQQAQASILRGGPLNAI